MKRTVLYENHLKAGGKMVDFEGWEMPLQYTPGILKEHLLTRSGAGLFDVSHMGRFLLSGSDALAFLQKVLTNNAAALEPGKAQYTIIPEETGGAVDDAYLYRFFEDRYHLVVNASNSQKDWEHLNRYASAYKDLKMRDITEHLAMISLQGPEARCILLSLLPEKHLPEPMRNECMVADTSFGRLLIARTGYTGEPVGFELFCDAPQVSRLWEYLLDQGASPAGLGARDSLRLEAGLPLYGHELGKDPEGRDIPIFACPLAKFAVSFHPGKGDYVGSEALKAQYREYRRIVEKDYSNLQILRRVIRPVAVTGRGVIREGARVYREGLPVGWITSGTMVPYWKTEGVGTDNRLTDEADRRAITLAMLDAELEADNPVEVELRGTMISALVVRRHLGSEAPPFARPILPQEMERPSAPPRNFAGEVELLLAKAVENTRWRGQDCINLIPSEMTMSPTARLLSVMDPSFRYAEHKVVKALGDAQVFYYQGTDFIHEVEEKVKEEFLRFLGCARVEPRVISGQ
ncbi:MAG: glycine cleavage system aminomethyltransferase GcvT, partial [Spirochaetales bacterium]|nr:glycine cleavage system aminomethyltransferase GcvT [Spirochaetales bacterium]